MFPTLFKEADLQRSWTTGTTANEEFMLPVVVARQFVAALNEETVRAIWSYIEITCEQWKVSQIANGVKPRPEGRLSLASVTRGNPLDMPPWLFSLNALDHVDLMVRALPASGFESFVKLEKRIGTPRLLATLVLRHAAEGNLSAVSKAFCHLYLLQSSQMLAAAKEIVESVPFVQAGKKVKAGAKKGHEATHGTLADKAGRWGVYQNEFNRIAAERPTLSKERICGLVAAKFKRSIRTVKRHIVDSRKVGTLPATVRKRKS